MDQLPPRYWAAYLCWRAVEDPARAGPDSQTRFLLSSIDDRSSQQDVEKTFGHKKNLAILDAIDLTNTDLVCARVREKMVEHSLGPNRKFDVLSHVFSSRRPAFFNKWTRWPSS